MARTKASKKKSKILPDGVASSAKVAAIRLTGVSLIGLFVALVVSLLSYAPSDPTLNTATGATPENLLGLPGAIAADLLLQTLDAATFVLILPLATWGWRLIARKGLPRFWIHLLVLPFSVSAAATAATFAGDRGGFLGGLLQDAFDGLLASMVGQYLPTWGGIMMFSLLALIGLAATLGLDRSEWQKITGTIGQFLARVSAKLWIGFTGLVRRDGSTPKAGRKSKPRRRKTRTEPTMSGAGQRARRKIKGPKKAKPSERDARERQASLDFGGGNKFKLPTLDLLTKPKVRGSGDRLSNEALERNAQLLESVLDDFGIQGQIVDVSPGPVVTLYELEPAPGTKSSRVVGLAHDIARSMSVVSARIAVVPGRNVIGIELPNSRRDTVFLRELLASSAFERSTAPLALALGKDISGSPVIADLTAMPHLLVAGTTGSGKSVGLNAMILSLLYRLPPDRCKLIMVDPKMLELSIYEDIPHLLTPVVTEPKKAVVALKWAVREMEERYRAMSKLGVRNITSYNKRVSEAQANNEVITRKVQTGFDKDSGQPIYEKQEFDLLPFPLIVIVIDEMADLMLVAGKDVEATVQRLSQMARAAGIHLIMATQRPSVDVITGTIKANFPTRISFQVTSKIDSRTILGEQGAEQLLGHGDMLYMVTGGRVTRIHGPFVSDREVEKVAAMLKRQGAPQYLTGVTEEPEGGYDSPYLPGGSSSENELYDKAVDIVLRDRKASTSYIQRRLKIGYNRAASIIEEMEDNGVISGPNHAGRREILVPGLEE